MDYFWKPLSWGLENLLSAISYFPKIAKFLQDFALNPEPENFLIVMRNNTIKKFFDSGLFDNSCQLIAAVGNLIRIISNTFWHSNSRQNDIHFRRSRF